MCKCNFTISYRVYSIDITNRYIYNVMYVKWIYIITWINQRYHLCKKQGFSVRGRTLSQIWDPASSQVKPYIVKFCQQRS